MTELIAVPLWFSAVACGLMAGLYFAFSTFIMQALASIDRAAATSAMNAINRVIQRSLFMPLFLGTSLSSLALAVIGLARWGEPGSTAMAGGGAIYFVGMFVVTMFFNVPLNNALAAGEGEAWSGYVARWTRWNHVRTVASTAALILFILAIAQQ